MYMLYSSVSQTVESLRSARNKDKGLNELLKMPENVSITDLPSEVVDLILEYKDISIVDVLNLSMTCKKLYYVYNGQIVWKRKYFERWPWMREVYKDYVEDDDTIVCWKKLWEDCLTFIKKFKYLVSRYDTGYSEWYSLVNFEYYLSYDYYNVLTNFIDTDNGVSPLVAEFILGECEHIYNYFISYGATIDPGHYYYAFRRGMKFSQFMKSWEHMKRIYVTNKWMKLLDLPAEKQTLSKFGSLAYEWFEWLCHLGEGLQIIKSPKIFDSLTNNTMSNLHKMFPEHPIFFVSQEKLNFWRENVIEGSQWNCIDGRNIAQALRITMLETEGVVEKIPGEHPIYGMELIEMSLMLENTGRRLGFPCDCANVFGRSSRVYIRWKECCGNDSKSKNVYLDFMRGDNFLEEIESCPADDEFSEHFDDIMTILHKLVNGLMTLNPKAVKVKKCIEICQFMRASYNIKSYLEFSRLLTHAQITYKTLEKLYIQKPDRYFMLKFENEFKSVIRFFYNERLNDNKYMLHSKRYLERIDTILYREKRSLLSELSDSHSSSETGSDSSDSSDDSD